MYVAMKMVFVHTTLNLHEKAQANALPVISSKSQVTSRQRGIGFSRDDDEGDEGDGRTGLE